MDALLRVLPCIVMLLAACVGHAQTVRSDGYPSRPVRLVAPFAPGGPVDVVARLLAPKLSEGLSQQFYVENHPGGSGNNGTALVAKAAADGYTVLVISMKERLTAAGFEVVGSAPAEFAMRIEAEIAKWGKVIREANVKAQ